MSCEKVSLESCSPKTQRNGREHADREHADEVLPHQRLDDIRVLMYSHDTFGLGHLRRCRAVAHALVERFKGIHVLIISGSPIAGAFDFRARVDFVKIPSVIKLYNGEYTSIGQHIDLHETMALRRSLIMETARSFHPDLFIVDKEPVGLRGELEQTLAYLKAQGCALVLGLREIMDAPNLLAAEWAKNDIVRKIGLLYDYVWIYGPSHFWDPLANFDVAPSLKQRMHWTGYLRREVPSTILSPEAEIANDALLVTVGGGGDGAQLVGQVLAAYEYDRLHQPCVFALGPFMHTEDRNEIRQRAAPLPAIQIIDFDAHFERLIRNSAAVVSMGGYNTFCEILSLDKRALLVPRVRPREEQLIRARRAAELNLIDMLHPDEADNPAIMAQALRNLLKRPLPSSQGAQEMLDGLSRIGDLVHDHFNREIAAARVVVGSRMRLPEL
jgi:predicted glycosyltransferase